MVHPSTYHAILNISFDKKHTPNFMDIHVIFINYDKDLILSNNKYCANYSCWWHVSFRSLEWRKNDSNKCINNQSLIELLHSQ